MTVIASRKKQGVNGGYVLDEIQGIHFKMDEIIERIQLLERHCYGETWEEHRDKVSIFNPNREKG